MSLKERMRTIIETSRLNNNEKIICLSILANDKITIVDMHNCLSISQAVLNKICKMLLEYGYIAKEQITVKNKTKDVWIITDKIFQESENTEKTYYRQIND
jgi:predicted transcriptional regulator